MNDFHKQNMRKHIAFLRKHADTIRNVFDMERTNHPCGTPSCSLGYMPLSTNIPVNKNEYKTPNWNMYISDVIGIGSSDAEMYKAHYMFGSHWTRVNNTPEAAAARMEAVLYNQIPIGWQYAEEFAHPIVNVPQSKTLEKV